MGKNLADVNKSVFKRTAYGIEPEGITILKGWNPRADLDRDGIEVLAKSISEIGLKVPIIVRREGDEVILVDGERRLRAVLLAKKKLGAPIKRIDVEFVAPKSNEGDAFVSTVIANELREDLSALDRAKGYARLIDFGHETAEIAAMLGHDADHVTRSLRLLEAAPAVRKALKEGVITASVVSDLVRRIPDDPKKQEVALSDAIAATGGEKAKGKDVRKAAVKAKGKDLKPRRRTLKHKILITAADLIDHDEVEECDLGASYVEGYRDALKYAAGIDNRPDWLRKKTV